MKVLSILSRTLTSNNNNNIEKMKPAYTKTKKMLKTNLKIEGTVCTCYHISLQVLHHTIRF